MDFEHRHPHAVRCAGGRVAVQAGGGIVDDSDPDAEYDEAMVKVRPLLQALAGTG